MLPSDLLYRYYFALCAVLVTVVEAKTAAKILDVAKKKKKTKKKAKKKKPKTNKQKNTPQQLKSYI